MPSDEPVDPRDIQDWRSYVEPLIEVGERLSKHSPRFSDPQARLELYRHLYSGVSMAYMGLFLGDVEHPDFWPLIHQAWNYLGPNPDDTYYLAPLEGDGTYRISGYRGTVHYVDAQIGSGLLFPKGQGGPGPNLDTYDLDDLTLGDDGWFDVILSSERPKDYTGNWWHLGDKATYILIRNVSYDWLNEIDGRYAIERLDRPAIRPRQTANEIAEALNGISVWTDNWTRLAIEWPESYKPKGMVNKVVVRDLIATGGVGSQFYIEGQFELGPDEALIYETPLPHQCRYWNVQLTDMLWAGIDWTNRQTTLNGHTSRIDTDGIFRAVISAKDPGVPNWLDSAGYEAGTILGRWTHCSDAPVPEITRVKLSDVRKYLPSDTPNVTPAEREADLRKRRMAAQLRRRW